MLRVDVAAARDAREEASEEEPIAEPQDGAADAPLAAAYRCFLPFRVEGAAHEAIVLAKVIHVAPFKGGLPHHVRGLEESNQRVNQGEQDGRDQERDRDADEVAQVEVAALASVLGLVGVQQVFAVVETLHFEEDLGNARDAEVEKGKWRYYRADYGRQHAANGREEGAAAHAP